MTTLVHLVLTAALLSGQPQDATRAIIEQALDQPVTLELSDTPIADACGHIANASGLSVRIGGDALALLPYGDATRVNVRWQRTPVRDGLRALSDQIGMDFFATDSGIELVPSPPLARLGRAASWEELGTISKLLRTWWKGDNDDEFEDIERKVRFEGVTGDAEDQRKRLAKQVERSGAGRAADVLSRACSALGYTWIPWADEILIMTQGQHVRYQLQRNVSLRFHNAALADVLLELSRQAGVPIRMDPASAAALPDRVKENLSLVAEGVTVAEALEQLVITAGLAYEVTDDGIVLNRPPDAPEDAAAARSRDPIVGKIIVQSPDGAQTYEWFIRESDLSPDERDRLEKLKREGIERMRRDLPD